MLEIDFKGWKRENEGRPLRDLVREVVQNVLDTQTPRVLVDLHTRDPEADGHPVVLVEDFDPTGIASEREVYTVHLGGKADDPRKRGRMGRGLKEAIAIAREVIVVSTGCALHFDCVGQQRSRRRERRGAGTLVKLTLPKGRRGEMADLRGLLAEILWPEGMEVVAKLDGEAIPVRASAPMDVLNDVILPTVVLTEAGWTERRAPCTLRIHAPLRSGGGTIYEMGIPVESDEHLPFDVDVGQRVPLHPGRDTIRERYRRMLYREVLERRAACGRLTQEESRSGYVDLVVGDIKDPEARDGIITARFGTADVVRSDAFDSYANVVAQDRGRKVVVTRTLPESWRRALDHKESAGEVARQVLGGDPDTEARRFDRGWQARIREPATGHERDVVAWTKWLAERLCPARTFEVMFVENPYPKPRLMDVGAVGAVGAVIRIYEKAFPEYLCVPISPRGIAVVAHEVAHLWNGPDGTTQQVGHVGLMIHRLQDLAGLVGWVFLAHGDEIRTRWPHLIAPR